MSNRVFVSGIGAISACGDNAHDTWVNIVESRSGIKPITGWDVSNWPVNLGGEITSWEPNKWLPDRKLIKAISRHDVFGIYAASQAIHDSNILLSPSSKDEDFALKTGIYVGSPGNKYFQQYDFVPLIAKTQGNMQEFGEQLFDNVHPMWLLRILPNNVLAYVSINFGFKGANQNITNHAASGSQAIIEAYHAIKAGIIERAVVVGYDSAAEPQALFYYDKLGIISHRHLKPFDEEHDGTLLADGAAALVLESEESVNKRQGKVYAQVVGGNATSDAQGLFSLDNTGEKYAYCIQNTLEKYATDVNDVAAIIAHGNGNMQSDATEAIAIDKIFSNKPPVTGFKWALGHTLSASGILDTVLATYVIENQHLPGIPNLNKLDANYPLLNITKDGRTINLKNKNIMILNRGYAGMNACLILKNV